MLSYTVQTTFIKGSGFTHSGPFSLLVDSDREEDCAKLVFRDRRERLGS